MNILYSSNHKKEEKKGIYLIRGKNVANGGFRTMNHYHIEPKPCACKITVTLCCPSTYFVQKRETSLVSHVRLLRRLQEKFYRYGLGTIAINRKPLAKTAKIKHANLITKSHYHKLFGTYVKLVTFEIECLHMKNDSFVFSFSHSVIFNIIYNQRFKKYS